MPIQAPQWTEFLSCPICFNIFDEGEHKPISLACGHTVCRTCLSKLIPKKCPFDQNVINRAIEELPVNFALLQLVGVAIPDNLENKYNVSLAENVEFFNSARRCIEELAIYLKPVNKESGSSTPASLLSRPMQRKLVTLVNCQLIEDEGRCRAVRAARSLGERTVTELILQHQNPQQLSANLWAGVRARGCQFLGPAMQEEVLKLILLALEDGSALSRKVLVLFVVQRLEAQYPQASKTAIGHVVQLLYRASCFKVTKREEESSLMQLKEEFRTYDSLRREHDSQIVQIATEAGLRISPEQWSSLLYGDTTHKSHMQSIIDKLQTPQSFAQSINELTVALQRTGDPGGLAQLKPHLHLLSNIDPGPETISPSWEEVHEAMQSIKAVVEGLVDFTNSRSSKKQDLMPLYNPKYKTSMCRDLLHRGKCPRGASCTFAHTQEEMEKYRKQNKKLISQTTPKSAAGTALSTSEGSVQLSTAEGDEDQEEELIEPLVEMPRIMRISRGPVTVPIVRPCSLPSNMKAKLESSIYASADLKPTKDTLQPNIIPVTGVTKHMEVSNQSKQQSTSSAVTFVSPSNPSSSPFTTYRQSHAVLQQPHNDPTVRQEPSLHQPLAEQSTAGGGTQWRMSPAGTFNPPVDEAMMRRMITMMPSNPYTIDRCGLNARDTVYYNSLVIRARGKSPSKQLEELQNRKKELLSQLNKTKEPTDDENSQAAQKVRKDDSSDVQSCGSAVTDDTDVASNCADFPISASFNGDGKPEFETVYDRGDVHMSKSLADSKATSLISMSVPKAQELDDPLTNSSYDEKWSVTDDEVNMYTRSVSPEIFDIGLKTWSDDIHQSLYSVTSHVLFDNDEFVPFSDEAAISKYGPISRMIKTKVKAAAPVQVTAAQHKGTTPVTAVTPLKRPHPLTSQVPSRFTPQSPPFHFPKLSPPIGANQTVPTNNAPSQVNSNHGDHKADPNGVYVATSLPTALLQPHVLATANKLEGTHEPWALKDKIVDPKQGPIENALASNVHSRENLQNEIAQITSKIQHLQTSEDDRLMKELENIERNIVEAERQVEIESEQKVGGNPPRMFVPSNLDLSQSPSPAQIAPPWDGSQQQPAYNSGREPTRSPAPLPVMASHPIGQGVARPRPVATPTPMMRSIPVMAMYRGPVPVVDQQRVKFMQRQPSMVHPQPTVVRRQPAVVQHQSAVMPYNNLVDGQNGRQMPINNAKEAVDFQRAREAQFLAMSQQQARVAQECEDRRIAEDIAMQEMEKFVRSSICEEDY